MNFILCFLLFFTANAESLYEAGKLIKEEVTIVGAGIPPDFCIKSPDGFQLDSGHTRTGSIMIKRKNGVEEQVNIYIPLAKKVGYDEPIDQQIKKSAEAFCKQLHVMKGKKVSMTFQEYFQEDDGATLKNFYLRGLTFKDGSKTYSFENNSTIILGLAPAPNTTVPAESATAQ